MKKTISVWLSTLLSLSLLLCACTGQGAGSASTAGNAGAESSGSEAVRADDAAPSSAAAAPESQASESTGSTESASGESAGSAESTASGADAGAGAFIEAPQISAADFPVTDGSTATLPLAWMLYRLATGEDQAAAERAMTFTKTNNAYIRLMDQEAHLVIAYEAGPNAKEDPRYEGLTLKPIGLDALVFLCNTANPVESLTTDQLKDIYTGKIRNWSEIGGEDQEIIAFQREINSGSQTLMEKLLMQGTPMMDAPRELRPDEMGELVDNVAGYANTGNALGYSVYYYARNMYQRPNLRFMAADGVLPSPESIRAGEYPYVNPFYAAIRSDEPEGTEARKLFDWLTGEDGQALVEEMGYVSVELSEKKLPEGLDGRVSLESGTLEGNTRKLAISGEAFDGDPGVVILDENFQVSDRIDDIKLRAGTDITRIRGRVFPACLPVYAGEGDMENEDTPYLIGLYDIESRTWAVEPAFRFCYTESPDGESAIYHMGDWPEWGLENGQEVYKGTVNVYDDTGALIRTDSVSTYEEFDQALKDTSYKFAIESIWDESGDFVTYDFKNGLVVTVTFGGENEEGTSRLERDGEVLAEGSSMVIRPFTVDEADEDFVPYMWSVISVFKPAENPEGDQIVEDAGYLITGRDGDIIWQEDKGGTASITAVDEKFFVSVDWNSGKYSIRDYSGRELFSWIRPGDWNEFW